MQGSTRRLAIAAAVAAGVLTVASAAFACTYYKGKFTVSQGSNTSTAEGSGTNMSYCKNKTPATVSLSGASNFSASVARGTTSGCLVQLPDGVLDINYQAGTVTSGDCMTGQTGNVREGGISVTNGSGSGSYPLTGAVVGAGDICVSTTTGGSGNQIPVNIV